MSNIDGMLMDSESATLFLQEVTKVTIDLANVMLDEAEALREMRIKDVEVLQAEKLRLAERLHKMKNVSARSPGWISQCDDAVVEEFERVTETFSDVLKENHKRLSVARKVNDIVVKLVKDSAKEQNSSAHYDVKGDDGARKHTWSISLNEVI